MKRDRYLSTRKAERLYKRASRQRTEGVLYPRMGSEIMAGKVAGSTLSDISNSFDIALREAELMRERARSRLRRGMRNQELVSTAGVLE